MVTAEVAARSDPLGVAAGIVRAVAAAGGWRLPDGLRISAVDPLPALLDGDAPTDPALLGELYEAALAPEARSAGVHYTPADLAGRLVTLVVPGEPEAEVQRLRVWDPACGGGAFLLAAADALLTAGSLPTEIVAEQLWGTDIDPGAVAVAEAALWWWGCLHGADVGPGSHLEVADALLDEAPLVEADGSPAVGPLAVASTRGFDVVVANPPFQGQLAGGSIRPAAVTAALRARWGTEVVRPYTDTASLFLVAGSRALAPGGRLVMILPTSVLAARDAAPARAAATEAADLTGLWVAGEPVFRAAVQVCAVVLHRPGGPPSAAGRADVVQRWKGRAVAPLPTVSRGSVVSTVRQDGHEAAWAGYALVALGVPDPPARFTGRLGTITTARAGFRDEYYGLVGHVVEAALARPGEGRPVETGPAGTALGAGRSGDRDLGRRSPSAADGVDALPPGLSPLITSGLIDPGRCAWGERPARFARQRYDRPAVDLAALAAFGGRADVWVRSLAVPKVVVATQTRVGGAAVDGAGRWVASSPTVAVVADPDRLWEVAAVICSPVGTIAALAATAGASRAGDAIRHSVASVADLPLPVDADAWVAGADALRRLDRSAFLAAMAAAYGLDATAEVDDWWSARAPWPGRRD